MDTLQPTDSRSAPRLLRPITLGSLSGLCPPQRPPPESSTVAAAPKRRPPHARAGTPALSSGDLSALLQETALLARRARRALDRIHRGSGVKAGQRHVLGDLERVGPQTVPQLARARSWSRQHVQGLVNSLRARGYVELLENPAHRRSRLVRLTERGRRVARRVRCREAEVLSKLERECDVTELRAAARVLAAVRRALERVGRESRRQPP